MQRLSPSRPWLEELHSLFDAVPSLLWLKIDVMRRGLLDPLGDILRSTTLPNLERLSLMIDIRYVVKDIVLDYNPMIAKLVDLLRLRHHYAVLQGIASLKFMDLVLVTGEHMVLPSVSLLYAQFPRDVVGPVRIDIFIDRIVEHEDDDCLRIRPVDKE
jgi:hypothetical protein